MLRVAAVSYFNARPLLGDLAEDPAIELLEMPPAEVAAALLERRVEVGLVPVAALLEDERLTYLPGLCIGANGEVDSVFLWLREEISADRRPRIALDPHSRTSRLLTRLTIEDQGGIEGRRPEFLDRSPRSLLLSEEARADLDGFLVIGDLAMMQEPGPGWRKVDLAEAWKEATGLPFVFAVWGLDRRLLERQPDLADRFEAALEVGLEDIEGYVENCSRDRKLDPERARRYLRERIVYRMSAEARRGLSLFLDRARRLEEELAQRAPGD